MANKERIILMRKCIDEDVWSIDFTNGVVTTKQGSIGWISNKGYRVHRVTISGKRWTFGVHEVIAVAIGWDIEGKTVDHINSNKLDNRLCNLQILSGGDNARKAVKDGLVPTHKGELNGSSKLTWKTVDKIRKEYEEGTSQADLSRLYGVHKNTIWNIVTNKSWVK